MPDGEIVIERGKVVENLHSRIEDFLRDICMENILKAVSEGERSIVIDFLELDKYDYELADALLNSPEEVIKAFEEVLNGFELTESVMRVRFRNLPESSVIRIKDLRSVHLGKMVTIEGIIRQASEVRPEVVRTVWECPVCGHEITIFQTGFEMEKPKECVCGNRKGFTIKEKTFSDVQRIVIEESPEMLEGNEQPSRISVILRHDLVDPTFRRRITPGNVVRVSGILKEIPLAKKGESKRYDIFVEANYVEALTQEFQDIEITPEDEEKIKEIAAGDPWKLIVNSIAPSIYGHDKIKEAIALQLFGGVRKQRPDGTWSRGDIHLLLVGDPGAGKSQILKYVANLAPKSRYVSGKGASAVGLTATVVKDEFLRGWTLEAGAIVLANGGIVCIDEMDKISKEDIFALHEAMEQQSITVAKANIFATLRAQTSVLAAANPKFGRFDLHTPIADQINLPETILSRFDLIFAVKDIPNPDKDEKLADHILSLHKKPEEAKPLLNPEFMKKYISYAKKYVHPKLSDEATRVIKDFFVELRRKYSKGDSVPISPRQLEALVRMTEASARLRLSPIATKEDALRAVDLMRYTLFQLAYDVDTQTLDIDRIEGGTPASKRSKIVVVMEIIKELEKEFGKEVPKAKIIERAEERKLELEEVEKLIDELRMKGHIIEPRQGYVQRVE